MRDKSSEYVDRVEREHERVVVTRNGRPAAVLISPDDLQSLEETLAILADPEALRGIREGQDAIRSGDVIEGPDAHRRPAPQAVNTSTRSASPDRWCARSSRTCPKRSPAR